MKVTKFSESLAHYRRAVNQAKTSPHFGYKALDDMIEGLLPGSLTVVSGATSMGKTSFLANCAYNMAVKQGKQVLFFSLESGDAVTGCINKLSGETEIENLRIVTPETQVTIDEVSTTIKDNLHFAEVVIIDHLHFLLELKGNTPIQANIGNLVRQIQILAHILEIPFIVVAHIRKLLSETSIPGLQDLKDSAALYQDPANVIILHRFKKEVLEVAVGGQQPMFQNHGLLVVAKCRDFGKTGTLKLEFDPDRLAFGVEGEWPGVDRAKDMSQKEIEEVLV